MGNLVVRTIVYAAALAAVLTLVQKLFPSMAHLIGEFIPFFFLVYFYWQVVTIREDIKEIKRMLQKVSKTP